MAKLLNQVLVFVSAALPVAVALEAFPGSVGHGAATVAGILSGIASLFHRAQAPVGAK